MNEIIKKLTNEGWFINEIKFMDYLQNNNFSLNDFNSVKQFLLNTDIKHYGESWINITNKSEQLNCRGVLQINKLRNVSIPEIEQDNKIAGGLFKYSVTDGVTTTTLLDLQPSSQLSKGVDIGSKVLIRGNVLYKHGMLLAIDTLHMSCIGGKVLDLIKAESVQKSLKDVRKPVNSSGKAAPQFIPFGNKLDINIQEVKKFRSMKAVNDEQVDEFKNTEFSEKRQAALAEVKKAKTTDVTVVTNKNALLNTFHSGATSQFIKNTTEKQDQADLDLSFLMSYGFNFTESKRTLHTCNNDAKVALDTLLKNKADHQLHISAERGRGRRGRGGGRNKRNQGDSDGDDKWFDPAQFAEKVGLASRPNTTTSLAELIGGRSSGSDSKNIKENDYFNSKLIRKGYECLAQVMDGSYQPALVLEILPNKCLKIRYSGSGEVTETNVASLKSFTGEKIPEHMIPIITEPLSHYNSRTSSANNIEDYRSNRGYGNRGRGRPSRRRGGRYDRGY